jgi:hypothetical protein
MSIQNDLLKEALGSAPCWAIGPSDNGAREGRLVDQRRP